MKQMYFILMALLISNATAIAREDVETMTTGSVTGGGGFPHFIPQAGNNNGAVAQSFRLVARTNARYDGSIFAPLDSTNYAYSNGRGGLVNPDDPKVDEFILFDDSYTYIYNSAIKAYDNRLYRKQTFDNNNLITSLTYSSWHPTTSAYKDSARYLYQYIPGSNKIGVSVLQLSQGTNMWVAHDKSSLVYSGNNVTDVNSNSYEASFTYDANNNITSIEDKVLDHATGNLYNNHHKQYTYDAAEQVATYTLQNWDAATSTWVNYEYWEYTYTAGQLTSSLEYSWNGSWDLYAKHIFTYRNLTDKTSEQIQLWDAGNKVFTNSTNEIWDYDANGKVTSITTTNWDKNIGGWRFDTDNTQVRFYYEYYAPTGIAKVPGNGNIGIYPVPATTSVTLNLKWQSPQAFNAAIYNMSGQVVMSFQQLQPSATYSKQIDITNLAEGNYIIKAIGTDEILTDKLVVKK